ncbi:uncharacterized protein LOC143592228 [Bidens hawaiensis]|uniref:uncharacterized protein LOC143592228 n=1 Tax=Bidens hawaiensis TaxID=980011 RepID=UPI00404B492A
MAAQGNGLQTQIPKLLGRNYYHWHIQMRVLLESQDLWGIFETGCSDLLANATEAVTIEHRENQRRDKKALHILFQASSEPVFDRIATSSSSKDAWDILQKAYKWEQRVQRVKLQTLRCEFDIIRMTEKETIEEYFNKITTIVNKLQMNEEKIEEQKIIEKILRTLTRKFESVVVAIEESKDVTTMSTEELMGILQSHELRLKQYDAQPIDQAFQVQNLNSNSDLNRNRGFRNFRGRGRGKGRIFYSNREIKCYNCQKIGHISRLCAMKNNDEHRDNILMHENDEDNEENETMF